MTGVGLAVHRTFHAVHHSRNFRLFFVGQAVSVTGTWVQFVAASWLVLRLTGSGVALGVVTALTFAPILLFGAWAGVLADRHDKRRILLGTQTAFAALALALWVLVWTGVVELWMVYALSFLQGVVTAIDNPARQSFFAEMVDARHLTNAVSLNSAVMTGTRIVGPALAGLLIASVGLDVCFLVNGLSYLAVIASLLAMRVDDLHRTRAQDGGGLRAGLRYVLETRALRTPLIVMAVVFTFSFNFAVLMPLLADGVFDGDAGTLGSLLTFMGIGSLVGALAMARDTGPNPTRLMAGAIALGVVTIAAAAMPTLPAELAVQAVLGLVSIVFMITGNTTLQLTSRAEMRGRVMALYSVVFLGGTPVGAPLAGWTAEVLGARWALAIGGLIAVGVGLAGLRALRAGVDPVGEGIGHPGADARAPGELAA
jgi:MFS family permease